MDLAGACFVLAVGNATPPLGKLWDRAHRHVSETFYPDDRQRLVLIICLALNLGKPFMCTWKKQLAALGFLYNSDYLIQVRRWAENKMFPWKRRKYDKALAITDATPINSP